MGFGKVLPAVLLSIVLFPFENHAMNLRSGRYVQDRVLHVDVGADNIPAVSNELVVTITRNGNHIQIKEVESGIVYNFNIGVAQEQAVPPEAIDKISKSEGSGPLGRMLKKITVDSVVETSDKLTGNINIYLERKSIFGLIKTKVSFATELKDAKCELIRSEVTNGFNQTTSEIPCIKTSVGRAIDVKEFTIAIEGANASLLPTLTKLSGAVFDLVLNLIPIGIEDTIIRVPRM